jgi:hypothetical protein
MPLVISDRGGDRPVRPDTGLRPVTGLRARRADP